MKIRRRNRFAGPQHKELERKADEAMAEWNIRRMAVCGYLAIATDPEQLQMDAFHTAFRMLADAGVHAVGASKERYDAYALPSPKANKADKVKSHKTVKRGASK